MLKLILRLSLFYSCILFVSCNNTLDLKDNPITSYLEAPDPNIPTPAEGYIDFSTFDYIGESHNSLMSDMCSTMQFPENLIFGDLDFYYEIIESINTQKISCIMASDFDSEMKNYLVEHIADYNENLVISDVYENYFCDPFGMTPTINSELDDLYYKKIITQDEYEILNSTIELVLQAYNSTISDEDFISSLNSIIAEWNNMIQLNTRSVSQKQDIGKFTGPILNLTQHSLTWWNENPEKLADTDTPGVAHVVAADAMGAITGIIKGAVVQGIAYGKINNYKILALGGLIGAIDGSFGIFSKPVSLLFDGIKHLL